MTKEKLITYLEWLIEHHLQSKDRDWKALASCSRLVHDFMELS